MRRLACALAATLLWSAPAGATTAQSPVLGTIPAYPGATRPLHQLESAGRAIALTTDKPDTVIAYYMHVLGAAHWVPAPEVQAEVVAAHQGQPAWLTFTPPTGGRVDIVVSPGKLPKTGKPVTLITYESHYKP